MHIEFVLSGDEIEEKIPYKMLCSVRYGNIWNTMQRKQRWKIEFSIIEQEKAEEIFKQAYRWYTKGVPSSIRIEYLTLDLLDRITEFCFTL